MSHNPDRIVIWPGYFDNRVSRREGRRVGKDCSVVKPDLEGLSWAARQSGVKKMKREEGVSHPSRPWSKEGRLWISKSAAESDLGTVKKEEILQIIGHCWRELNQARKDEEVAANKRGPKTGDKRARAQRKTSGAARQAAARAQKNRQSSGRKKWKK